ncbi:DUF5682 family protein, partial [Streptomyces sp. NPDC059538]|uniref:DUF5682 family protein n=1 Tax=Streptomyces sp. NPDC059538 TaxID=3346860 RepID=UPI0036CAE8A6
MTYTAPHTDPRAVVDALAAAREPYLIGVRHHSPALAAVVPALLDASGADAVCVELPAEFQPWLEHLADPETHAPVALAGTGEDGRLAFYPFADFSPELAAIRWAHRSGAAVICCDLPLADRGWTDPAPAGATAPTERQVPPPGPAGAASRGPDPARDVASATAPDPVVVPPPGMALNSASGPALDAGPATEPADASLAAPRPGGSFADALTAAGTGRDGDDLWDRAVEVLAPGCSPEAVRRAALGVGWALRADTSSVAATDLAREAHMRSVIAGAAAAGHRVAAVIGAFHAPALPVPAAHGHKPCSGHGQGSDSFDDFGRVSGDGSTDGLGRVSDPSSGSTDGLGRGSSDSAGCGDGAGGDLGSGRGKNASGAGASPAAPGPRGGGTAVTSFVPYSFDLLDSRSGYPAGIRDPRWQQAVLEAGGDPARVRDAASVAVTGICRELRRAGHTAGT